MILNCRRLYDTVSFQPIAMVSLEASAVTTYCPEDVAIAGALAQSRHPEFLVARASAFVLDVPNSIPNCFKAFSSLFGKIYAKCLFEFHCNFDGIE